MNNFYCVYLFTFLCLFDSCTMFPKDSVESYFDRTADSLCIQAYSFLRDNLTGEQLTLWKNQEELLIQDITSSAASCRSLLEQEKLPFSVFCEYLLPIQIDKEPIENWREKCFSEFYFLKDSSLIHICDTINGLLKKDFTFSLKEESYATMSWSQLRRLQKGDCYHMAKSVLYPLRALGYPCTIDFSPCWGNTTGGHSWNVVYIEGKMIPFMGREKGIYAYDPFRIYNFENPERMNPARYPGKVYRKTFSANKKLKQLIGHISMDDLPPFLSDCRMMDVTTEYLPVSDVEIEVADTVPVEESVYLAVYSDDWTATAYTDTYQNRIATFKDVKNEMLYMPVVYRKGNIYPIDRPFIVDRVGEKRFLTADDSTERCVVSYLLPLMTEMSTAVANKDRLPKDIFDRLYSGEARKRPVNGAAYSLFYWNANQWQYIGTEIATNNHIIFPEVPQNALLYLADKDKKFVGRCFTLNKREMIWW